MRGRIVDAASIHSSLFFFLNGAEKKRRTGTIDRKCTSANAASSLDSRDRCLETDVRPPSPTALIVYRLQLGSKLDPSVHCATIERESALFGSKIRGFDIPGVVFVDASSICSRSVRHLLDAFVSKVSVPRCVLIYTPRHEECELNKLVTQMIKWPTMRGRVVPKKT